MRITLLLLMFALAAMAQPKTVAVRVNADGTFSPQVAYIKSGDTVRWDGLTRTDSIVTVNGAGGYPAMCNARGTYDATDVVTG